jgi:hypothetical protein
MRNRSFTYEIVRSLEGFSNFLSENNAKKYILDGNFPEKDDGGEEFLLPRAVKLLNEQGITAGIIVFSCGANAKKYAETNHLPFVEKTCPATQGLEKLLPMLQNQNHNGHHPSQNQAYPG